MNAPSLPSPDLFFDTLTAYQKAAALKAAIDLDLFTALAESGVDCAEIKKDCRD